MRPKSVFGRRGASIPKRAWGNRMSIDLHTVSLIPGTQLIQSDRVLLGQLLGVANAAGESAGAAVAVPVSFADSLPPNYFVDVCPSADVTWYITAKTSSGFTVNLNPRLAANTIGAGTFDVRVTA